MKKKIQISAIIFAVLVAIVFVGQKFVQTEENKTEKDDETLQTERDESVFVDDTSVVMMITTEDYTKDGERVVVRSEITLPGATEYANEELSMEIENYYANVSERLGFFIEDNADLAKNALAENPDSFKEYLLEMLSWISFEDENLVSIARTAQEFTGGAQIHPTLYSETFRVSDGALMLLNDILSIEDNQENMLEYINKNFIDDNFYGNADELLYELFNPQNYFIAKDGLYFYYQKYDIAPGIVDLPVFVIPYSELELKDDYKYLGEINE